MKKFLSLLLAAMMVAVALCSCAASKGGNGSSTASDNGTAAVESAEDTPAGHDYDILFSWKVKIDGTEYAVPFEFSELAANGYALNPEYDQELNGNTYCIMGPNPKKDGVSLQVFFWNPSSTAKKLSECKVGCVKVDADGKHECILPGDFKFDETVTAQTVLDKYGMPEDPDDYKDSDDETYITYRTGNNNYVSFEIHKKESMTKYNCVTVKNLVK